jgi:hypothetical protein
MEREVGFDLMLRRGGDECIQRLPDRLGARGIHPRRSERCGLGLDSEAEVDHVEHVMVSSDGRGLDGERRRLGHRKHERAAALEGLDQTLGAQPSHRLADDRARDCVLIDELGFRWELVAGRQLAGEDLVLQPGDDPLGQCRRHRRIIARRIRRSPW